MNDYPELNPAEARVSWRQHTESVWILRAADGRECARLVYAGNAAVGTVTPDPGLTVSVLGTVAAVKGFLDSWVAGEIPGVMLWKPH